MLSKTKELCIKSVTEFSVLTDVEAKEISSADKLAKAKQEFYEEKYREPVFRRELYDINYNIRYSSKFAGNRRTLSVDEAWKGVMEKAWDPVKYIPQAIIRDIVLKETIKEDKNSAYFVRISVQRPFQSGYDKKYTVVREEVSIDKINKIVYFMGRKAESSDYKLLDIKPEDTKSQITFLDEHKLVSIDNDPVDVWTLIALHTEGFKKSDQKQFVEGLGASGGQPYSIYKKTQLLY